MLPTLFLPPPPPPPPLTTLLRLSIILVIAIATAHRSPSIAIPHRQHAQFACGTIKHNVMFLLRLLFRLPSKLRRRARRSRITLMLLLLLILCLLIAPPLVIYRPPGLVIGYLQYRWPFVLWRVSTSKKIVALTVDDAPSEHTNQILALLDEHNAHATFFLIGSQVPGKEPILQSIVKAGNELANHAMHDEPSRSLTDDELVNQITTVQKSIVDAYTAIGTDEPPRYFRPGSGFFSTRMRKVLDSLQYRLVLGSIYPHDPQIPYPRINAAHILSMLRPGAIIICHDRRAWTVPMLKRILPEMRRRGYQVVTVTELLKQTATP